MWICLIAPQGRRCGIAHCSAQDAVPLSEWARWVGLEQQMGPLFPRRLSLGIGWPILPGHDPEGSGGPALVSPLPTGPRSTHISEAPSWAVPHEPSLLCPWVFPWVQWAVMMQVCEPEKVGWYSSQQCWCRTTHVLEPWPLCQPMWLQGHRWPQGVGNREGKQLIARAGVSVTSLRSTGWVSAPGLATAAPWALPTLSGRGPRPSCQPEAPHASLGELAGPGHPWTWLYLCLACPCHLVRGPSRLWSAAANLPRLPYSGPSWGPDPPASICRCLGLSRAAVPVLWWPSSAVNFVFLSL